MSIIDTLRPSNTIEHAPSPELDATLATGSLGTGMKSPAMADPVNIQATYYIEQAGKERRYYRDLEGKDLAFRATNKVLTTKQADRATVAHMLDVAHARGWGELHVRGSAAFKQEVWIEGQARGLSVKGYEPSADDRRNLDARRKTRQQHPQTTEPSTQPAVQPAENTIAVSALPVAAATQAANEAAPVAQIEAQPETADNSARPKREAAETSPPAKDGEQQQYPRIAKEPWMQETGGYASLKPDQQESAQRSHERWLASGTEERPHTMGLQDYVSHVQEKEAEARAKAGERGPKQRKGKPEPALAPSAPAQTAATENGAAEAAQLSPDAKKVLSFVEQRIESQMANFTREVKEDLRAHAAQALAKREAEGKPVKVASRKPSQKQAAKQDAEQPAMRVSMS